MSILQSLSMNRPISVRKKASSSLKPAKLIEISSMAMRPLSSSILARRQAIHHFHGFAQNNLCKQTIGSQKPSNGNLFCVAYVLYYLDEQTKERKNDDGLKLYLLDWWVTVPEHSFRHHGCIMSISSGEHGEYRRFPIP
jgi:hypothetical protein